MRKDDFIRKISERTGYTQAVSQEILEAIENLVIEIIATEDKIRFSYGVIGGKTLSPRSFILPNGQICTTPEKHGQPYYHPTKKAKE